MNLELTRVTFPELMLLLPMHNITYFQYEKWKAAAKIERE